MSDNRAAVRSLSLMWPAGLLLVALAMEVPAVTLPVFLLLDAIYVGGLLVLIRRMDAGDDRLATTLVGIGVGIFAMVGFTGPPTADEPGLMMINTAALFAIAVAILLVGVQLVLRFHTSEAAAGVIAPLALLGVGTTVYLANLLARVAVFLSGASEQQAAVEDTAWVAYEYLRGLEPSPDFMGYLLVWMDLLQLGYVATVYVFFACAARRLRAQGAVADRPARLVERTGIVLTSMIVLGVTLAAALPRELDLVPAWAAFVASIPFMTTLLPFALGVGMLSMNAGRCPVRRVRSEVSST